MSATHISFVLVPGFSMIALYSALEPLRVANRFAGKVFGWSFVSADGEAVTASNGIPVSVQSSLADMARPNLVVVCASYDHEAAMNRNMRNMLRKLERAGVWLAGLDAGPIVLADAGLLDDRRATCHWEMLGALREGYPRIEAVDAIYVIDGPRLTASGGTAPLDLMVAWVASLHGQALARRIADTLVHARHGGDPGGARIAARTRFGTDDRNVLAAISAMEEHLEDLLTLGDLAAICGLSPRQLERRFSHALGMAPMRFYLSLRLERAERLLTYSHMSVRDVGLACGFSSLAQFSRAYKSHFGLAPSQHRRKTAGRNG